MGSTSDSVWVFTSIKKSIFDDSCIKGVIPFLTDVTSSSTHGMFSVRAISKVFLAQHATVGTVSSKCTYTPLLYRCLRRQRRHWRHSIAGKHRRNCRT